MSDSANIIDYYDSAQECYAKKNFLDAAINAYWCKIYCREGDPWGMSPQTLETYEKGASRIFSNSIKKLPSTPLSKTMFMLGCQCEKALWLHRHRRKEMRVSAETQAKFDRGHIIGKLALQLFPDGTDASETLFSSNIIDMSGFHLPYNLQQQIWVDNTRSALTTGKPIYEAAFIYNGVFAAVDILVKTESGFVAYEVKSSSEVTDTLILDNALQYYVINNNIRLADFVLVHVNKEYLDSLGIPLEELNTENCDLDQLFVRTSVKKEILPMQDDIAKKVSRFKVVINNGEPKIEKGAQCDTPYECYFKDYCNGRRRSDLYDGYW